MPAPEPDAATLSTTDLAHPQSPKVTVPIKRHRGEQATPTAEPTSSISRIAPTIQQAFESPVQAGADDSHGPPGGLKNRTSGGFGDNEALIGAPNLKNKPQVQVGPPLST